MKKTYRSSPLDDIDRGKTCMRALCRAKLHTGAQFTRPFE
jgi:hypothetical protein